MGHDHSVGSVVLAIHEIGHECTIFVRSVIIIVGFAGRHVDITRIEVRRHDIGQQSASLKLGPARQDIETLQLIGE